jgi:transaldolase/glucose-6-phosphate isomerase
MNPLQQLYSKGQSFWLDYISRSLLTKGELKKLIDQDGLRGMTSNPTIFEKAISAGSDYDAELKKEAKKGKNPYEIFEELAISDIRRATDAFKGVYKESKSTDGYVSLEVSPTLANDTQSTLSEAKRLFKKVGRANLMIKIPGTPAGIPAIEEALAAGVNVNITLLFSVENYKQVVEAYLKALERRVKRGLPVKNISSVASFFVSRVDSSVDKKLDEMIAHGGPNADEAKKLLHKAAVANAKVAYAYFEEAFQSDRFKKLQAKGAQVQRLLWASTGTKDKRLSDVFYIDELIGPQTVNTMPPATIDAFRDHGNLESKLLGGLWQAREDLAALNRLGIDLGLITKALQDQGVQLFEESFNQLLQGVGAKRELLLGHYNTQMTFSLGSYQTSVDATLKKIAAEKWTEKIWKKDAALWKTDDAHQKIIKNSLGWLTVMRTVQSRLNTVNSIVADVRKAKFTHALILGMGGSSLCPEVLRLTFGKKAGYPDLAILDSTEPASVLERAARSKPEKTLYVVASKSGSTTEPNAFLAYFFDQVRKKKGDKAGENFIAITDPGTMMEALAKEKKFRHIVLNPSDIGGRYSALSFFGMLPAALMGIDVKKLLERAVQMADACSAFMPIEKNPGVRLGAAMGSLAKAGRNKVTFFLSKDVASFATWVEQLIAESTGKEGVGILPIESEPIQQPTAYGDDRVFVWIRTNASKDTAFAKKWTALKKAGLPVIEIVLKDKFDITAEFFRWEIATAVAGAVLGIDPFDQPNVQEAKDATKVLLSDFKARGAFPSETPWYKDDSLEVYTSNGHEHVTSLVDVIREVIAEIHPRDYVAFLAYIERNEKNNALLQIVREEILKAKKVATTVGFGPRFLHSTGQLHKGGDNSGVFVSITADDKNDAPIPGEPFKFSVLKEAQARGDWQALKNKNRRAVHIHFHNTADGFKKLIETIKSVLSN